jgi:hypothetical protein
MLLNLQLNYCFAYNSKIKKSTISDTKNLSKSTETKSGNWYEITKALLYASTNGHFQKISFIKKIIILVISIGIGLIIFIISWLVWPLFISFVEVISESAFNLFISRLLTSTCCFFIGWYIFFLILTLFFADVELSGKNIIDSSILRMFMKS